MNTDIRLLVSFKGHRKRKRLKVLLGASATDYLIDLWLTVAQDCPEGILIGWDEVDIALAAGWDGDQDEFVKALIDCGWLEKGDVGVYEIHDWQEHQGWASHARMRSEAARKAAEMRWANKRQCDGNATAMRPHQKRNAPSPSPNPSPNPKKNTPKGVRKRVPDPRIAQIFKEIKEYLGYPDRVKVDPVPNYGQEGIHIKRMLKRSFTPEEIVSFWKAKLDQRGGEYVSAHWVNQDIGKKGQYGEAQRSTAPGRLAASIGAPSRQT